ncbi:MAG TPA: hypothetical protein VH331_04020 [Allosphingosinicella sp.]|jgi:hypothetical protein|nr:hypothetical protein [Allosphingosinicella sp.]
MRSLLVPRLSFDDAEAVGAAFHDQWEKLVGPAPIGRDDLAWADLVQFVTRAASSRLAQRQETDNGQC